MTVTFQAYRIRGCSEAPGILIVTGVEMVADGMNRDGILGAFVDLEGTGGVRDGYGSPTTPWHARPRVPAGKPLFVFSE